MQGMEEEEEEEDFLSCGSTRWMQLPKLTQRASTESMSLDSCPLPSQREGNGWKSWVAHKLCLCLGTH